MKTFQILLALVAALGAGNVHAADTAIVELSAGAFARENCIVELVIPPALASHNHFALARTDTGKGVPVQVDRHDGKPKLVWIVRDKLDAGTNRRYSLTTVAAPLDSVEDRVTVNDDGTRLLVKVGGKPVFNYHHATVPSPDPAQPYYARSGYIHPVYSPVGQAVTDDFNPDHPHQHGIMMAWRKMTFDGRSTNGWDQKAGLGKVEHAALGAYGGGPVFGFFTARLRHVDLTAPGEPVTALDETWYVRTYAFDDAFLFDITSTQTCASAMPVSIDTMHYGGMMIRGHADWHEHRSFDYLTDEGRTKSDGNQTRPRWVDLAGPIATRISGTLIMGHTSNFRFPQPVRLHPTMPYFCFAPASLGSFTIEPGRPFVSQYRFYVHDGALEPRCATRLWNQYADAHQVQVVPIGSTKSDGP